MRAPAESTRCAAVLGDALQSPRRLHHGYDPASPWLVSWYGRSNCSDHGSLYCSQHRADSGYCFGRPRLLEIRQRRRPCRLGFHRAFERHPHWDPDLRWITGWRSDGDPENARFGAARGRRDRCLSTGSGPTTHNRGRQRGRAPAGSAGACGRTRVGGNARATPLPRIGCRSRRCNQCRSTGVRCQ